MKWLNAFCIRVKGWLEDWKRQTRSETRAAVNEKAVVVVVTATIARVGALFAIALLFVWLSLKLGNNNNNNNSDRVQAFKTDRLISFSFPFLIHQLRQTARHHFWCWNTPLHLHTYMHMHTYVQAFKYVRVYTLHLCWCACIYRNTCFIAQAPLHVALSSGGCCLRSSCFDWRLSIERVGTVVDN